MAPGLAIMIQKMKKGKPDKEPEPEEDDEGEEPKSEHAAMSAFIDAVHAGDDEAASNALHDYLQICYPQLEEDEDEDGKEEDSRY